MALLAETQIQVDLSSLKTAYQPIHFGVQLYYLFPMTLHFGRLGTSASVSWNQVATFQDLSAIGRRIQGGS